tara:strand:+ start:1345 stop:2340 length:996 start_codon:yes stop_codon:yes gene_type:complete
MVVICKKCFKRFQYPSQLKQHLNRKTPCNIKKKTKKVRKGKGNFKGKGNVKKKGKYQKKYNKDNKLVPHIFLKTDVFKHYKLKDNIFNTLNKTNTPITSSNIEPHILNYTVQYIKFHNPILNYKSHRLVTSPRLKNHVLLVVTTYPYTNHPYIGYSDITKNRITFIAPLGKERNQHSDDAIYHILSSCDKLELEVLFLYIKHNIENRKDIIINSKDFSLLQCDNITGCIRKKKEIMNMRITDQKKRKIYKEYQLTYRNKAIGLIKKYFDLLENQKYSEAYAFLKGSQGDKKDVYYGKQRLNTFFKNTKSLIGHLQIFISLYKLMYDIYNFI